MARPTRTLFKNPTIISMDPAHKRPFRGDVLVEGRTMAAVGGMIAADSAETIEASDCILLPGFVDTHRHTWQSLLRSTAVDWTLG